MKNWLLQKKFSNGPFYFSGRPPLLLIFCFISIQAEKSFSGFIRPR